MEINQITENKQEGCVRNAGWICAVTPGKCPDGRLLPLRGKFPQGGRS